MHKSWLLLSCLFLLTFISCSKKNWIVKHSQSTKITIDSTLNSISEKSFDAYLFPFKQKVDNAMNLVIGESAQTMKGHAPESLLSNFSADVYLKIANDSLKEKVDIAIVNMGGLRTTVPSGPITIRKVFELMPFENELVVLWLSGDKLNELLQYFASMGGEGVAGLQMTIKNKTAVDISIGGKALQLNEIYSIATNDYLAGGNDKMIQLTQYKKRVNTGIKIRTLLLNFVKNETKNGNKIQSKLDGRIRIVDSQTSAEEQTNKY